jgi:hypothetical protein
MSELLYVPEKRSRTRRAKSPKLLSSDHEAESDDPFGDEEFAPETKRQKLSY